jgi:hypothetical protein
MRHVALSKTPIRLTRYHPQFIGWGCDPPDARAPVVQALVKRFGKCEEAA